MTIIVSPAEEVVDYNYLKADIKTWLHRSDLDARIPRFIAMAEAKMGEDLHAKAMQAHASLVVGEAGVVSLPTDCKKITRLVHANDVAYPLNYVSPDEQSRMAQWGNTGKPVLYTVNGSQMEFAPEPDAIYTLELDYERHIPPLTTTSTSNWLLARSYNAYLAGSLMFAYTFLNNMEAAALNKAIYDDAIGAINLTDWHTGGAMRVRADNH